MGYEIRVNGDKVWESEGDVILVDSVKINNARGEVTVVGSHNQDAYLDITVNVRDTVGPPTYLDMIEDQKMQERRDALEPEPDETREGYVKADPETGVPMEETRVPMKDEATNVPEDEDMTTVPTSETEASPAPAQMKAEEEAAKGEEATTDETPAGDLEF